jgi:hypothetical protein
MLKRFTGADWAAGLAVVIGLLSVYLPWYSYTTGASRISVNGFRASALGDLFFLTIAVTALLLLVRHGGIDDVVSRHVNEPQAFALAAGSAGVIVLLQVILAAATGRVFGPGLLLALVAAIVLATGAWYRRPDVEPGRTVREP